MTSKWNILIIILILLIIFVFFYKSESYKLDDITIFSLWNNEFVIDPGNKNEVKIDVFKTIYNSNRRQKKVAPGSYGNFTIKLIRPEQSNYEIILKELTSKPKNLIFILNGQKYNSIVEMQEKINEYFETLDIIKIYWKWEYETNLKQDIEDTIDGQNAQSYIFEINAIVEQEREI